jgi:hypothetical protein
MQCTSVFTYAYVLKYDSPHVTTGGLAIAWIEFKEVEE